MALPIPLQVATILALGVGAQWLAWRLRLPSILLLLSFGLLAGPAAGLLDPDALVGPLLLPGISLAVGLILFEGGLSLKLREVSGGTGRVVRNLVSFGILPVWAAATLGGIFLLGLSPSLALLLGAILVVSGPTVVGPLLEHIRPDRRVASILKWEGILIDPVGALLAFLVFEAILAGGSEAALTHVAAGVVQAVLAGTVVGLAAAGLLLLLLRRYWLPDPLVNPAVLAVVLGSFATANALHHESGLLATTLAGMILANQRKVSIHRIHLFSEDLRVLLLSAVFILLSARLAPADLAGVATWGTLGFLGVLVLVARPLSVALSTLGSDLRLQERALLAWVAPRGIVAAAVASVFALQLDHHQIAGGDRLAPLAFLVILATVALYGLTAAPLARRLGVAQPDPQGVLFLGAHRLAREIAADVQAQGFPVLLVDSNRANLRAARMAGLPVEAGSILTVEPLLAGLGKLVALTANDELNSLAVQRYLPVFGRSGVYQLVPRWMRAKEETAEPRLDGRHLFGQEVDFPVLQGLLAAEWEVRMTHLTESFGLEEILRVHGPDAVPLLLSRPEGKLEVFAVDHPPEPAPGDTLIALLPPKDRSSEP